MNKFLDRLGVFLQKYRFFMAMLFLILIVSGGMFGTKVTPLLSGGGWDVDNSQSLTAKQATKEGFTGRGETSLTLVVQDKHNKVGTEAYNDTLKKIVQHLEKEDGIESIYTLLDAPSEALASMTGKDKHTSIGFVSLKTKEGYAINNLPDMEQRLDHAANKEQAKAYLVGISAVWGDTTVYSQKGLASVEIFVMPLIFIVLLFIFRSVVSALTSLLVTMASVVMSLGILYFIASHMELSAFVSNAVTMLGMGIGIDYTLFMVSRFKDELKTKDKLLAIKTTLKTAGRTVFFSGLTVIASMSSLFLVNLSAIQSIAIGSIVVVAMSIITNLLLMPVILYLLGNNINRLTLPWFKEKSQPETTGWYRFTKGVMKKPLFFLFVSLILIAICAFPAKNLKTFTPDVRILPSESLVRQGYQLIEKQFERGATNPISIVIQSKSGNIASEENLEYINKLNKKISQSKNVENIYSLFTVLNTNDPDQIKTILSKQYEQLPQTDQLAIKRYLNDKQNTMVIDVSTGTYSASEKSARLVKDIQDNYTDKANKPNDLTVSVGGPTSEGIDTNRVISDGLIPAIASMLVIGYIILFFTFKSVFLPLKAIMMNLLSIGATYGILVFVFADGHGASLFHVDANGYIQNFVPILLVSLLFGLSTDYEVLLLSNVKELYEKTGNNTDSVALGLNKTGPLISGAALLMIAVFGGFAFSNMLPIQTLGFGMAVAILVDSTIIRFIMVPASMALLGKRNWWMPFRKKRVVDERKESLNQMATK
ncbi:MMPL family transporter [Niallia sp. 01092]|uniref:MMPL family transporter n=1 Tax=unclassified Niallia TaxID=2837522 RepID=UPI003FD01587